jgi:hypothetical protein
MKDYTWSYKKESVPDAVKIEYILKYGDLEEIYEVINDYGLDYCKKLWIDKIISEERFSRLNYFLAGFIFNISKGRTEILKFLKDHQKPRFEGIKSELFKNRT